MKSLLLIAIIAGCFQKNPSIQSDTPGMNADSVFAVFVGRTPCQEIAKQTNMRVGNDCFKLKWKIILYQDPVTLAPTTYLLNNVIHRVTSKTGEWIITKGTKADPNATVYQLDPGDKAGLLFMKGDDNVLFFLDQQRNLLVGNEEFSYTLNRSQ